MFEVVLSVRVVMKFPNAMFASVVGTTRSKERSYGWRGTSAGNGASA